MKYLARFVVRAVGDSMGVDRQPSNRSIGHADRRPSGRHSGGCCRGFFGGYYAGCRETRRRSRAEFKWEMSVNNSWPFRYYRVYISPVRTALDERDGQLKRCQ